MVWYSDGSTYKNGQVGQDSSCICLSEEGEEYRQHIGDYSVNYAELYAIKMALEKCQSGDVIRTDSQLCYWWLTKRVKERKRNQHLLELIYELRSGLKEKMVTVEQVGREDNLAGIALEERPFYGV